MNVENEVDDNDNIICGAKKKKKKTPVISRDVVKCI